MNKKFSVLSIDGGGIRGVFAAAYLAEIEAELARIGKPARLWEHFDLICGTSTGGIIALGLGLGIPAQKLADLYMTNAQSIFHWFRLGWISAKHGRSKLQELVREAYRLPDGAGDACLQHMHTRVCVPCYDLLLGKPRILKTPHTEQLLRDRHIPAYQVALATAAAPTYFSPYCSEYPDLFDGRSHEFNQKVDGGVFANNPALVGLVEAHRGLDHALADVRVLSVGTGYVEYTEPTTKLFWGAVPRPWGRLPWLRGGRITDLLLQAQSQHVDEVMCVLAGGVGANKVPVFDYRRVQTRLSSRLGLALDSRSPTKLRKLSELAKYEYQRGGSAVMTVFMDGNNHHDYQPPSIN